MLLYLIKDIMKLLSSHHWHSTDDVNKRIMSSDGDNKLPKDRTRFISSKRVANQNHQFSNNNEIGSYLSLTLEMEFS